MVSRDCPLITVVGGRLIANRAIDPALLSQADDFRHSVFNRFEEEFLGKIAEQIPAERCHRLLRLIATISPFRAGNSIFLETAADFLGIKKSTLNSDIGTLVRYGILLRRGQGLRITPALWSDHVVSDACLSREGVPTGYAEEVYEKFAPVCLDQVLRNLAELDWRVSRGTGQQNQLLDAIWQSIETGFRAASNGQRTRILGLLESVAYYQPARILSLIELAMREPATAAEDELTSRLYQYTHKDVLDKLPALLKLVSYTTEYLPECCELLWQIGRDGPENVFSSSPKAIKTLQELAGYEIEKYYFVTRLVVDAVERIIRQPDAHDHVHSPIDILDPVLKKSGDSTRTERHKIIFIPFTVRSKETLQIRQNAIGLIAGCARAAKPKVVLRALESMHDALADPVSYQGLKISAKDLKQWQPEQMEILALVESVISTNRDPLVQLGAMEAVNWYAVHGANKAVKSKCSAIIHSIADSYEFRLTRALSRDPQWNIVAF